MKHISKALVLTGTLLLVGCVEDGTYVTTTTTCVETPRSYHREVVRTYETTDAYPYAEPVAPAPVTSVVYEEHHYSHDRHHGHRDRHHGRKHAPAFTGAASAPSQGGGFTGSTSAPSNAGGFTTNGTAPAQGGFSGSAPGAQAPEEQAPVAPQGSNGGFTGATH